MPLSYLLIIMPVTKMKRFSWGKASLRCSESPFLETLLVFVFVYGWTRLCTLSALIFFTRACAVLPVTNFKMVFSTVHLELTTSAGITKSFSSTRWGSQSIDTVTTMTSCPLRPILGV